MKQRKLWMPLDIQFFSEPAPTEPTPGAEPSTEPGAEPSQTPSFDDLLKDKAYQSEFDKRVSKALETAKGKWQTEQQKAIEDAKTEAEKLAKMNAEQKAQYEREKQESDFNKRMKDLTTRELKAEAYEQLAEKNLPKELVELLNYESADTVKASMEAVEKAFQSAVEKAVNEKLKGKGAPKTGDGASNELQAQIAKAMRGQI